MIGRVESEKEADQIEQKIAVQMVTFSVIIIVVILTLVSFIRIYSSKKEHILKDMKSEAAVIDTVITDHLNYSRYFVNLIGRNIQGDYKNLTHIHDVLKEHFTSQDFNMLFGWRKYSWVDEDFREVVTSNKGIISDPKYLPNIKEAITAHRINSVDWKNKILFLTSRNSKKSSSLKIIDNILDKRGKQYVGSVVLSYDIDTMVRSLNRRKKNAGTNFIILDKDQKLVAHSKSIIKNVIDKNEGLDKSLKKFLKKFNDSENEGKDISYLDMVNGINYYISGLKDLPFIVVVNIDNDLIKNDIIDSITKKFIEVCVFAFSCLFIIISIYKRETYLRSKAEKATLVANNATRAKTNFLAFTAHEIRSPLGFIQTGSEIMKKELMGKLPVKYKQYADGINKNAKVILDFITDILDESQIIEGKFKIVNRKNNVKAIINEAIRVSRARYDQRRIDIVAEIENKMPLLICDKRRLMQVISNLISNSIKYSEDNTTITVSARITNKEMEITVRDQGVGMKQNEIPIAMSNYGTIHNKDYVSTGSYGLGLPIVKMLLDAHEAKLIIESEKGKGTAVKIIFPSYKLASKAFKKRNN